MLSICVASFTGPKMNVLADRTCPLRQDTIVRPVGFVEVGSLFGRGEGGEVAV